MQLGGEVGALAVDLASARRGWRRATKRPQRRLPRAVEEVVGGGGDDRLATKPRRERRDSTIAVSRWLEWLAAKITGPLERVEVLEAEDRRATRRARVERAG